LILGLPLEIVHGPLRIGTVYLAGALFGSLLTSMTDPGEFLAGASGGVYALMLAHLPTLIMNWREMKTFFEWFVR
jgi:rhomboid-related protein 1/2/3